MAGAFKRRLERASIAELLLLLLVDDVVSFEVKGLIYRHGSQYDDRQ
jgi:hypothetical protein